VGMDANKRFADSLPQQVIPGQGKLTIPKVEVDRTRIQPYVVALNLGGTITTPIVGCVPVPHKVNIDERTRHLRFIHDGVCTINAPPPMGNILWTWQQPQAGSRFSISPSDEVPFDDLFFEFNVLYLEVTPGTGARIIIYGW